MGEARLVSMIGMGRSGVRRGEDARRKGKVYVCTCLWGRNVVLVSSTPGQYQSMKVFGRDGEELGGNSSEFCISSFSWRNKYWERDCLSLC